MQLTHIAIWTNELERSRDFYIKYFNGKSNEKYVNPKKGFASYFVTFKEELRLKSCSGPILPEKRQTCSSDLPILPFLPDRKRRWMS